MATIYCLSTAQSQLFLTAYNKQRKYVESIKNHLDGDSLKSAVGASTLVGLKDVWVAEEPNKEAAHHLISYNAEYQSCWGNRPIFGNVVVIFSPKAWAALPADKRLTDDAVKAIQL